MMGPERLLAPLAYALASSQANQTEIVAEHARQGISRYAGSRIHQTTEVDEVRVWVRAVMGKSVGQASGNSLEREALAALVSSATETARRQAPNPEFETLPGPEPRPRVRGFDPATAEMSAEERAATIGTMVERVGQRGWTVSGTYLTEARELAVVNSLGTSVYAPSSRAFLRALPDSGKGTGYGAAWSYRAADLDLDAVIREAVERCELNRGQREVEPGAYEAIFSEMCVAEALLYLARNGFSGRAYEEGNSFISGRLGEQVTGSNVTIWDDATDPRSLAIAVDYEGVPKRQVSLIENGVARGVAYDSATAQRVGKKSNAYATHPEVSFYGPVPQNLFMQGGNSSIHDMIRATNRGLLLTRFHYTHGPDPKRAVMTGTTRDGTFLIEHGKIVGAARNLRLTQSIPELFEGIEMLGQPRLCQDWWSSNGMGRICYVCPPIKVRRAVFSSGTLF
jgi:predicted Zn-dependent protease